MAMSDDVRTSSIPTPDELDDPIEGAIGPVEPRRMSQVLSVRLDPDVAAALRDIANERGTTVSELLRQGALAAANEPNVMQITWITPPTQVSADGRSVTFDASSSPTPDLRGALFQLDEEIVNHQERIRLLMRLRRNVAEIADNADIDARHEEAGRP